MTDMISAGARPVPAWPRRTFLRVSGAGAAALVLATGCSTPTPTPAADPHIIILQAGGQAGDVGVENYLYLLAQLQAAFYQAVLTTPPTDFTPADLGYFTDLRDHEVVHREFYKYALGTAALPTLPFTFASLTLTTRAGVLAGAQTFEELSTAAYAAILPAVSDATLQGLMLKIASVEARHAALLRDLLAPGSFAPNDAVDGNGQAVALAPAAVATALAPYLAPYTLSVANLPLT